MSKKILFVIAGPRLKGASAFAARAAAEGAAQGGADVEIVELPRLARVQSMGCISCMRCQISPEYRCALDDDLARLVARFPEFDAVVFSTPVFFFSMPAQLKGLIDRTFSLVKNSGGRIATPLAKVQLALIVTSGGDRKDSGVQTIYDTFRYYQEYADLKPLKYLYFGNTPDDPARFAADPQVKARSHSFGLALARQSAGGEIPDASAGLPRKG